MAQNTQVTAHGMRVFPTDLDLHGNGGNPTTIFLNAGCLTSSEMQQLARACKHECGFVTAGPDLADNSGLSQYNVSIRYWVPGHEMEMCGHATIGALWLMDRLDMFSNSRHVSVSTMAGTYEALLPKAGEREDVFVSQPKGSSEVLSGSACKLIAEALNISMDSLIGPEQVQNSITSRTKTLVPVKNVETLDSLQPIQKLVHEVCESIGSTGLYPYAMVDETTFSARQFPKSSGYLEDPATGIAATALACGLLSNNTVSPDTIEPIKIRQGWAMGNPSEIKIILRRGPSGAIVGYWLTGKVTEAEVDKGILDALKQVEKA